MQPLISWKTVEFEKKDRHPDWIWTAGLIFGVAAVLSFFYGNIFFGIFLCVAGVAVIYFALQEPQEITIELTEKSLFINERAIDTKKITGFWIDESQKTDKLLLAVKGSITPMMSLLIENVESQKVRDAFSTVCPETEMHQSLGNQLFDKLGF